MDAAIEKFKNSTDHTVIIKHMKDPIALEKDVFKEKYHAQQKIYVAEIVKDYNDAVSQFGTKCASYIYETFSQLKNKGNESQDLEVT